MKTSQSLNLALVRFRWLLCVAPTEALRFFLAASSLAWAFLLFLPGDTFERDAYALMRAFTNETTWACLHLTHGLVAIYSLLTRRAGRLLLIADPLLGAVIWTTSAACLGIAYPIPASIAPILVGACASWWLLVRYNTEGGNDGHAAAN